MRRLLQQVETSDRKTDTRQNETPAPPIFAGIHGFSGARCYRTVICVLAVLCTSKSTSGGISVTEEGVCGLTRGLAYPGPLEQQLSTLPPLPILS